MMKTMNTWFLLFAILSLIATLFGLASDLCVQTVVVTFVSFTCLTLAIPTFVKFLHLYGLAGWLQMRNSLGIVSVYPRGSGRYGELYDRISKSKDLKVIALSAESLVRFSTEAMTEALVNNNCQIMVLIAKDHSEIVRENEQLEGPDRTGQISTEIQHTITRLAEIKKTANERSRANQL
jgi:hypothetical protein